MPASTVLQALDRANPNEIASVLQRCAFGTSLLAAITPVTVARTGLTTNTVHIHTVAGAILHVSDDAGTTALTVVTGTPGAGEVAIAYDSAGLATLTFGTTTTGYQVKMLNQSALRDALAASWTGAI